MLGLAGKQDWLVSLDHVFYIFGACLECKLWRLLIDLGEIVFRLYTQKVLERTNPWELLRDANRLRAQHPLEFATHVGRPGTLNEGLASIVLG